MLGLLVLDGIGGEVNGTDIVTINNGCATDRAVEFQEKLAQPVGFSGTIGHGTILGFCTRLLLGGPTNKIVPNEDCITGQPNQHQSKL